MNTTSLTLIALAIFAAGSAHAGDITTEPAQAAPTQKTRAEVRAELLQARADGTLVSANEQYAPVGAALTSTPPRDRQSRLAAAPRDVDATRALR